MAITPVLKRFDTIVYKPLAGLAGPVTPAAGVVLRFYAQGATVSQARTIPDNSIPFIIYVYHAGEIASGDQLYVENIPPANNLLLVTGVDTQFSRLTVVNVMPVPGQTFDAAAGMRLVLVSKPLPVFADPLGGALGTPGLPTSLTTDANGRAEGYIRNLRFDYTVTVDPYNPFVFHDAEGSFVMRC